MSDTEPIVRVNVTDMQGVLYGTFELTRDDLSAKTGWYDRAIGELVRNQIPRNVLNPERA